MLPVLTYKNITKTCPCNVYPYEPRFIINSKIGVCRGKPIYLIFSLKHRLRVLVRTPRRDDSSVYPQSLICFEQK